MKVGGLRHLVPSALPVVSLFSEAPLTSQYRNQRPHGGVPQQDILRNLTWYYNSEIQIYKGYREKLLFIDLMCAECVPDSVLSIQHIIYAEGNGLNFLNPVLQIRKLYYWTSPKDTLQGPQPLICSQGLKSG